MNLNVMAWLNRGKEHCGAAPTVNVRETNPQGPWSGSFKHWIAREVNPHLYEAIREALPVVDGAINRLTTLDGIIRVGGDNDRLVGIIEEWMRNVQVNDWQSGFQAFYAGQGNELYEQGCTVGTIQLDERGRDVVSLRVADSKGIHFLREGDEVQCWYAPPNKKPTGRRDGTDQVERVLRNTYRANSGIDFLRQNGYQQLQREQVVYASFNPEADNPYGVSIMRSAEFDARVLLTMKNSLQRVWERFGDPSYTVTLKVAKQLDPAQAKERETSLATGLANVLSIKKSGNSADFVNVVGKNDELAIDILGAEGQVLEIEAPARLILENIVSKTGLPSWMLGFHWSTAERLAQRQGEIALQESKTRFELRSPGLTRAVETMLRARGLSWKAGDWFLYQDLPSLQDLIAQAQAKFLDAQRELMLSGAGRTQPEDPEQGQRAVVTRLGNVLTPDMDDHPGQRKAAQGCNCGKQHQGNKVETYVEDEAALMRLERSVERDLLTAWGNLYDATLDALGLEKPNKDDEVFVFDATTMRELLSKLESDFILALGAEEGALALRTLDAWVRGMNNGGADLGADIQAAIEEQRARVSQQLSERALDLVEDATVRAYRDDIVKALTEGAYDGVNPRDVARELRKRFDAGEYNWTRLARSEIARAQGEGKLDAYESEGIQQFDWVPAGDGCPICLGLAAAGPYDISNRKVPVIDSHPQCRCTVTAVVED